MKKLLVVWFALLASTTSAFAFYDTQDSDFRYYIETASQDGVISGYSDGTFRPNNPVSFIESLKIAINTGGYKNFVAGVEEWNYWYDKYLKFYNLNQRTFAVDFSNNQRITRDFAIYIILKQLDIDLDAFDSQKMGVNFPDAIRGSELDPYIHFAKYAGIVSGYSDGTFGPKHLVSRWEFTKMVWNALRRDSGEILRKYRSLKESNQTLPLSSKNTYTDSKIWISFEYPKDLFLADEDYGVEYKFLTFEHRWSNKNISIELNSEKILDPNCIDGCGPEPIVIWKETKTIFINNIKVKKKYAWYTNTSFNKRYIDEWAWIVTYIPEDKQKIREVSIIENNAMYKNGTFYGFPREEKIVENILAQVLWWKQTYTNSKLWFSFQYPEGVYLYNAEYDSRYKQLDVGYNGLDTHMLISLNEKSYNNEGPTGAAPGTQMGKMTLNINGVKVKKSYTWRTQFGTDYNDEWTWEIKYIPANKSKIRDITILEEGTTYRNGDLPIFSMDERLAEDILTQVL